ncbi:glycosyltransferase family 2 protein [Microbispora hainanensis]|uniref:Glycosyltransferase family 2 protein n=1 Tax=Microbispora hainanensis TaxID=568844 RepID=A0ABZ1SRD8_9ACTN|nr:glycosyltransferase family 2 protein [Microbispora hainanensis]
MRPSVGVVIPTRGDRPGPLRAALTGVLAQEYDGRVEVVIVADGVPASLVARQVSGVSGPGPSADADAVAGSGAGAAGGSTGGSTGAGEASGAARSVQVLVNRRAVGLPGARNTGIAVLGTDLVAFCDDDDLWLPGKLAAQVAALTEEPDAGFASCAVEVEYGDRRVPRLAGTGRVTHRHLTRSRMMMVHSSTFLFRRGWAWVDESAPAGQNEDWDLALRAAWRHPIVHVDRPLVRVRWGSSHYVGRWDDRIAGLEWMLARHPGLTAEPRGAARVYGQLAFCHAALGRRREAARWSLRALSARPAEPRAAVALAVAGGLVSPRTVLHALHRRGHGI